MAHHELKTVGAAFDAVKSGKKRFEVRLNDRFFQPGDTVDLVRLNEFNMETHERLRFTIGWILPGGQYGIDPRYCVFQLESVEDTTNDR